MRVAMTPRFVRLAIVLATVALAGATPLLAQESVIIQRIIVKVNGEAMTQKELEQRQIDLLQQQGKTKPTTEDLEKITPDILVNSIDEMLIVQRGRELGFHMSDEQFTQFVNRIKSENKLDDAGLKAVLAQQGMTLTS